MNSVFSGDGNNDRCIVSLKPNIFMNIVTGKNQTGQCTKQE